MKFNIGDIIKLDGDSSMYIISDIMDFSRTVNGKFIKDIECELMKILPVSRRSFIHSVSAKKCDLQAKIGSKEHKSILEFVKKEREAKEWFESPDFAHQVANALKAEELRKNNSKIVGEEDDVIRYDKIKDIDTCLDALNDLNLLFKMFGDESYIQLKEVVHMRLKHLNKS
jgi:hypothetical protein